MCPLDLERIRELTWQHRTAQERISDSVMQLHRRMTGQAEDLQRAVEKIAGVRDGFALATLRMHSAVQEVADSAINPKLRLAVEELAATARLSESRSILTAGFAATLESIALGVRKHEALLGVALSRIHFPELDVLARKLEGLQLDVLSAPDEAVRRERLAAMLKAAAEGSFDLDLSLDSPEKRVKLLFQLLRSLFLFLLGLQAAPTQTIPSSDVHELRQADRERAQMLTAIAETIRGLTRDLHELRLDHPKLRLRVTKAATLRDGPSGNGLRVVRLGVGTELRLVTTVGRWYYVEVLDEKGGPSPHVGWVYRRNVGPVRAASRQRGLDAAQ